VRAAASNFDLEQVLDFTPVAFAFYLPPQRTWTNKFGQTSSFDDVCARLCSVALGQGLCHGCHALYALAIMLAADEQLEILSDVSRRNVRSRLQQAADALRHSQGADGCWGTQWFSGSNTAPRADFEGALTVTGHSLEWLAVAPQEIIEDPKMISRACDGLVTLLLTMPPGAVHDDGYNPGTHAANALKMWSPQAWRGATNGGHFRNTAR